MSYLRTQDQVQQIREYVNSQFSSNIVPSIMDYIRIPNLSPMYDLEWNKNGLLMKAAEHIKAWVNAQELKGASVQIIQDEGKPPLLLIEVNPTDNSGKSILFYGHYDKQPHFSGWMEGTGPTTPVIIDGKLYGRGGSDDGYSVYAAVTSIKACQQLGFPHPRCIVTIEGEEESGSFHYMNYLEKLKDKIQTPDYIFCLDSGCGTYDTMWLTTCLRGNIKAEITVKVLNEGVHSGDASGVVPSGFRILRNLLDRLEDSKSGQIHELFQTNVPAHRYSQACDVAKDLSKDIFLKFPYSNNTKSMSQDPLQAYLNKTWRPQLAVVGADGLPACQTAGNVLLPETKIRISLRLPPNLDAVQAGKNLKELIESNPPYDATVICDILSCANGWDAKETPEHLANSFNQSSLNYFNKESRFLAEGGSIPLMNKLQDKFPNINFIVTGVLGPHSNAHGPNEMLHLQFTENLICCMSQIVADTSAYHSQ
ncbi:hypothetical protein ABPG74_015568 [Tetrahymena malaccensis]